MPRACSICTHEQTATIAKAIAAGGSNREVATRFGVTTSSVQRHRVGCLRLTRRTEKLPTPVERVSDPASTRFDSLDPKTLIAGTARLVDEALELLEHAKLANDRRTALSALREARDGLALLMRAAGMLATDGGTTIHDNRQLHVALDARSLDELLSMRSGLEQLSVKAPIEIES